MTHESGSDRSDPVVSDAVSVDLQAPAAQQATGHDRYAAYTHQLSDETTATVSRLIVRIVPLISGATLGYLAENVMIGLLAASAVSLAFDLSMEDNSIVLNVYRHLRGS